MSSVAPRLKALRLTAKPPLSMRQAAQKLGMGPSSYGLYENANSYKKPSLPVDLARRIAVVFAEHGITAAEVMKLAGLTPDEAAHEARAVEAAKPVMQFVSMAVALPSEAALRDMFRSLLDLAPHLLPEDAARDELAEILAQRLPSGFAGIGPVLLGPQSAGATAAGASPPAPARDRPEPARELHT